MTYKVIISTSINNNPDDQTGWTITMITSDVNSNVMEQNGPGINASAQLNYLNNRVEKTDWTDDQIAGLTNYLSWIVDQSVTDENPTIEDFTYDNTGTSPANSLVDTNPDAASETIIEPIKPPLLIIPKAPIPPKPGIIQKIKNIFSS